MDVQVYEEDDLDGAFRLDENGDISMPPVGMIHLKGLSLRQAEEAISVILVQRDILKTAHVVVNLNEYSTQSVTVVGEVTSPGRYPILAPQPLLDVLAIAGGETAVAGDEIDIHRAGTKSNDIEKITYGKSLNATVALTVLVNPGDTVEVRRAGIVYVLGSVNRPGGYVMQESGNLTTLQVISLALGTAPGAATGSIRIIRPKPDGTIEEIPINYKEENHGKIPATQLHALDVLFIPSSRLKSIFIEGNSVLSAATSATIYTLR